MPSKTYSGELFRSILFAGLLAGVLDATAAIIDFSIESGKNPIIIFVYISSGVFGKQAFQGSQSIAIFGLLFHFLFAIIFSAFYFLIYPGMKFLHRNKVLSAIIYGIFVWLVMNLGVVPLTITHAITFHFTKALLAASILIACIGLPICFMAAAFYKRNAI